MKRDVSFTVVIIAIVLIYGLSFVMFFEFSLAWSLIAGTLLVLVFVLVTLYPRFQARHYRKFSIVETRRYGDRIIRIKGLNAQQRADFLWGHMKLYDESKGYPEWKPEVKIANGIIYFLYPSTVGLADFCNLFTIVTDGDYDSDVEGLELTAWYPMVDGRSKKQDIPFENKTLMLFRTEYLDHEDFVYFVTEYNHVYRMELSTEKLEEVKDVQANYEPMPDRNALAFEF